MAWRLVNLLVLEQDLVTTIVSKEKNANQTRLTLSDSTLESEVIDKDALDPPPQTSKKEEVDIKVQTSFMENLPAPVWSSSSVSSQNTASTLSARVQTMGRAAGFDSNRLPNTIFSSQASTPMEWCLASNDSLFSLHFGNTSFSKDQFILFRSGELNKYDEILNIQATFPPVSEPNRVENIKIEMQEPAVATPETRKTNFYESPGQHTKEHMVTPTDVIQSPTSLSHRSDESYNSTCSFQFPEGPQTFDFETSVKSRVYNWLYCFSCCGKCY
ncbi:hypothetical protein UlMin_040707 [Ulmus minor]